MFKLIPIVLMLVVSFGCIVSLSARETYGIPKNLRDCLDKMRPIALRHLENKKECDKLVTDKNDATQYSGYRDCTKKANRELDSDLMQSPYLSECKTIAESLPQAQSKYAESYLFRPIEDEK